MIKDQSVRSLAPSENGKDVSDHGRSEIKSFILLAAVAVILFLIGEAIIAHTAPLENLLLSTQWSVIGAIHGILGSILFISGSIGVYLGYRLLTGRIESSSDLRIASAVTAVVALATVAFGNWLYIGYRQVGMTQDYFLHNFPELHVVFFEFKENIALFTVPLAVAATFILLRYEGQMKDRPWIRTMVFLLLGLVFSFFLAAFGLGAAITKIKPV